MSPTRGAFWRRLNVATHRDLGYFFSALVIAYCASGLALNHVDAWNPDFVITRQDVRLERTYAAGELDPELVLQLGRLVDEDGYRVFDQPTPTQVKIYFEDATLHVHLDAGTAVYERIARRPVFFHANVLHRNSLKAWRWAADVFAVMLMVVTVTGLFILRGAQGLGGRGKWLILAGLLPPAVALVLFELK